mmetsp:Transcript_11734/g.24345  ORF Transcript_11734/g.24345 Transcript_11734/m.24345 type:complete len:915 (-) Transcript_11734:178-2922(-)
MASVASYNPAPIGGVDNHSHAHSHMDYTMDGGTASPGASVASSSASPRDVDQHHSHQDEDSYTASSASSAPSIDEDSDAGPVDDASGDEVDERMHEESDAFSFATANNEGSGAEFKSHDFAADEDDGEDGDVEDVVDAVAPVEDDEDDDYEDDNEDDDDQSSPHIQTRETQQDDVSEMSSDDRRHQGESSTAVPNNMSSYASSLNSNSSANLFNQPCDNNNYVSLSNDTNNQESNNKSSSSSMIDQESFYSHISSPQARFEANKQAFESRFSSGNSVLSNYSTASKKSAKSVRRRDVITPLADFGDWNNSNNSKTASALPIIDGATAGASGDGPQAGGGEVFRPVPVAPSNAVPSNPESAMVLHSNNNADNSNQWTLPEQAPSADSRALVVHSKHKSPSRPRGLEPDEAACRGRSGRDPPGESPNERPFIGAPRVNRSSDESVGSNTSRNSRKAQWNMRNVQWVDPKTVMNERDIDFGVLRHYELLANVDGNDDSGMDFPGPTNHSECRGVDADGDYQGMMMTGGAHNDTAANPLHPCSELLTPKRIRIATISSGYKKANFFVREDLDQRIYFHDLEDAINYMAKRGYARMRKEDELEWMKLLGKAHGVVKVGPTKKKQRYRKGKLVLIMSKPITDDYPFRTPPSSSKKNKTFTTLALVARKNTNSDVSTAASSHTSIGRSIRGPYKSYSEKFLAEQEEEKRILLGEPPRLMMLTNGPVDPEPQQELLQLTNGSGDEDDVISEGFEESSSKMSASKKSSNASEARMVNYRGGVMYFTPHQYEESDDDDDDDEDTEEEEDNTYQEDDDDETEDMSAKYEEEEEATTNSEEESACSGVESSHTDAESSTNSEMSSIARNSGVKIVTGGNGKSTLNAKRAPTPYDKDAMRKNRQSSPPDMEPISDDSEDSSLISGEA